jgi:hypothetical protein
MEDNTDSHLTLTSVIFWISHSHAMLFMRESL